MTSTGGRGYRDLNPWRAEITASEVSSWVASKFSIWEMLVSNPEDTGDAGDDACLMNRRRNCNLWERFLTTNRSKDDRRADNINMMIVRKRWEMAKDFLCRILMSHKTRILWSGSGDLFLWNVTSTNTCRVRDSGVSSSNPNFNVGCQSVNRNYTSAKVDRKVSLERWIVVCVLKKRGKRSATVFCNASHNPAGLHLDTV